MMASRMVCNFITPCTSKLRRLCKYIKSRFKNEEMHFNDSLQYTHLFCLHAKKKDLHFSPTVPEFSRQVFNFSCPKIDKKWNAILYLFLYESNSNPLIVFMFYAAKMQKLPDWKIPANCIGWYCLHKVPVTGLLRHHYKYVTLRCFYA